MSKIIDISHHQGDIDWSQACNDVDLAIIRIQYGTSTIDRKYLLNIEGSTKYKIPFGVYIYVTYKNAAEAYALVLKTLCKVHRRLLII
ncbi:GH25 family lysozyme [Lysinibacillus sp. FSL R5-0849]|uniref:GH25 family lysozyme n=1 Tax=Lysinibacillus sp. FSL R5-0849 TaxID=2921660 RepID=UPI00315A376B